MLSVSESVSIPERELSYRTSRSSGPGGQNVNKVETRVTVLFDVGASGALDEDQKTRVAARLATRMDKHGVLRVVAQKHRTQAANRKAARDRLALLLGEALTPERPRVRTRVTQAARRRRRADKQRRSEIKRLRRSPDD